MAEVKIHRGLDQIGGCITEISTDTSRVFIDFGQNLPGNGEPTTPEEDEKLVSSIFASNPKEHEAVFYTHGHEDHVALFEYIPDNVPQFMSEGTKALLSIKYDVLYEGAKLKVEELQTKECEEKEYSEAINSLVNADNKRKLLNRMNVWPRILPRKGPEGIVVHSDVKIRESGFLLKHNYLRVLNGLISPDLFPEKKTDKQVKTSRNKSKNRGFKS